MSGCPGAGKSTLAQGIGHALGAVVLDYDVLKSALLDAGTPANTAGSYAYATLRKTAASLLAQRFRVVLDSPCYYQELLDGGIRLAEEAGARYHYIECVVGGMAARDVPTATNLEEVSRRLRTRASLASQRRDLHVGPPGSASMDKSTGETLFRSWITGMKRPTDDCYLLIDTSKPEAECLEAALTFLS